MAKQGQNDEILCNFIVKKYSERFDYIFSEQRISVICSRQFDENNIVKNGDSLQNGVLKDNLQKGHDQGYNVTIEVNCSYILVVSGLSV